MQRHGLEFWLKDLVRTLALATHPIDLAQSLNFRFCNWELDRFFVGLIAVWPRIVRADISHRPYSNFRFGAKVLGGFFRGQMDTSKVQAQIKSEAKSILKTRDRTCSYETTTAPSIPRQDQSHSRWIESKRKTQMRAPAFNKTSNSFGLKIFRFLSAIAEHPSR